jgi:serpin B
MKRWLMYLTLFAFTLGAMELFKGDPEISAAVAEIPSGDISKMSPAAEGNNLFMIKAYKYLTETEESKNIFISPYSIQSALAMTFAGAAGKTEEEMGSALEFPGNTIAFHENFGKLTKGINDISKKGEMQLSVANSLWLAENYNFLEEFLRINKTYYNTETTNLNFSESEKARKTINDWVAEKTKDRIKDLIPPGILDALTKLVLTNAVYFKAEWAEQFKKGNTQKSEFTTMGNKAVKTEMMNLKHNFPYMENEEIQLIEMPYKGGDASMFVILPKKKNDLKTIEKDLEWKNIDKLIGQLKRQQVDVYFPKFKMSLEYELRKLMSSLGMKAAFNKGADFSRMNGNKDLYISAIIHKTFVEVDETGTEAAAATAVVMRMKSAMPNPEYKTFRADHPFFYFIRENVSGTVLFAGRVTDPSSK